MKLESTKIAKQLQRDLDLTYPHHIFQVKHHYNSTYDTQNWVKVYKVRKRKFWFPKKNLVCYIVWTGETQYEIKNAKFRRLVEDVMSYFVTRNTIPVHLTPIPKKKTYVCAECKATLEEDEAFEIDGAL